MNGRRKQKGQKTSLNFVNVPFICVSIVSRTTSISIKFDMLCAHMCVFKGAVCFFDCGQPRMASHFVPSRWFLKCVSRWTGTLSLPVYQSTCHDDAAGLLLCRRIVSETITTLALATGNVYESFCYRLIWKWIEKGQRRTRGITSKVTDTHLYITIGGGRRRRRIRRRTTTTV